MQMVSIIKGLMQGIAVLLILLGLTYVIDYQLNKENPYFEDPDAVEITLGVSALFLMLGGATLLFTWLYRENVNSLILSVIITFLLAFEMLLGYEVGIIGMLKGNIPSCTCTYQRPAFISYLGLLLFVLTVITISLIWARVFINWLKSSK